MRRTFVWADSFKSPYTRRLSHLPQSSPRGAHCCKVLPLPLMCSPSDCLQHWEEALAPLCRWAWLQITNSEHDLSDVPEEMHPKSKDHNFSLSPSLQMVSKPAPTGTEKLHGTSNTPGHTSLPLVPWPQTISGERVLYFGAFIQEIACVPALLLHDILPVTLS